MSDLNILNTQLSRRSVLNSALLGSALCLAGCTDAYSQEPSPPESNPIPESKPFPAPYVQLFPNTELNFEALFGLGSAGLYSEMGEVLTAVREANTNGADTAAYYTAFRSLADSLAASAAQARPVTARAPSSSRQVLQPGALCGPRQQYARSRARRLAADDRAVGGGGRICKAQPFRSEARTPTTSGL